MPVRKKTDPQPKLITLEAWAQRIFTPPPSIYTLRRMVKDCKIVPVPKKVGRSYYVWETAAHLSNGERAEHRRAGFTKAAKLRPVTLPLDHLRTLSSDAPRGPAVYFLWNGPKLLYVGMSHTCKRRIATHARNRDGRSWGKPIPFDRLTVLEAGDIAATEARYIAHYRPPFNG